MKPISRKVSSACEILHFFNFNARLADRGSSCIQITFSLNKNLNAPPAKALYTRITSMILLGNSRISEY